MLLQRTVGMIDITVRAELTGTHADEMPALLTTRQQARTYRMAILAFAIQPGGAHRACVGFVNVVRTRGRWRHFLDGPASPDHVFERPASDWIGTYGAEKRLVRLSILFQQPIAFRKRDHPYQKIGRASCRERE